MSTAISVMDDAITQSAAKLGFELREKQRQALLGFCQGRDVFVSSHWLWEIDNLCPFTNDF